MGKVGVLLNLVCWRSPVFLGGLVRLGCSVHGKGTDSSNMCVHMTLVAPTATFAGVSRGQNTSIRPFWCLSTAPRSPYLKTCLFLPALRAVFIFAKHQATEQHVCSFEFRKSR